MSTATGYSKHGAGAPIVLLHSSMSSKSQWKALIELLEPHYRVISIDLFGYGDVAYPPNEHTFSLRDEVERVESILDKEVPAGEPVHLVGHSYGAAVALNLTCRKPDKVKALTLFEPVAFHLLPKEGGAFKEIDQLVGTLKETLCCYGEKAATGIFINYWSGEGAFENFPEKTQNTLAKYVKKVLLDFQALFGEPSTLEDYANIDLPCCLIGGKRSPLSSRRIVSLLKETLPDNEFYQVDGGHMSPITHAGAVNDIIVSAVHRP